ncbi:GOLPH3/VPS74 family protein [Micromonospora eburnea]|uniref:Golgi phosphoprotein 3 (GPP34) n=1 Tax=Micromonospora eburnea TaxID=227316 RepID=A0A1C6TUZ3_9ACTN|nr:GPP34 family phosphoprotein [Micromonospora eburnea]SCL45604.1 Golgi phosphoprotein 3 (GPP34) [Micromonospora eburnea]
MSHAAFDTPPVRLPLRVELFVLTHNDSGAPLAHLPSLSLALAGAILTSLVAPIERVRVVGDAAIAVHRQPTGDPVADWALTFLARHHRSLSVREAVRLLGEHAYDKVTAGLIAGGLVEQVTRRRMLGRVTAYPPTDPAVIHRVRGRLRYGVLGYDDPDLQTDALAGLLRALRLESELYLDGFDTDLRDRLRQMLTRAGHHTPATEKIICAVEDLIGETAVSVYR